MAGSGSGAPAGLHDSVCRGFRILPFLELGGLAAIPEQAGGADKYNDDDQGDENTEEGFHLGRKNRGDDPVRPDYPS